VCWLAPVPDLPQLPAVTGQPLLLVSRSGGVCGSIAEQAAAPVASGAHSLNGLANAALGTFGSSRLLACMHRFAVHLCVTRAQHGE
jgi:hypothetical protein